MVCYYEVVGFVWELNLVVEFVFLFVIMRLVCVYC